MNLTTETCSLTKTVWSKEIGSEINSDGRTFSANGLMLWLFARQNPQQNEDFGNRIFGQWKKNSMIEIQSTIVTVKQRVLVKKKSDGQVIENLHKIVFNKLLSSTHMGMKL